MPAKAQTKAPPAPQELTTVELVDILSRIAVDPRMTAERLRHWVRMGLLSPIGDRHPGTGFHRRFDTGAIVRAGVLNVLADMGFKITALDRSLRGALDVAQNARRGWKPGAPAFLTVPLQRSPGAKNAPVELGHATFDVRLGSPKPPTLNELVHPGFLGICIVDLGQIFAAIEDWRNA